MKHICFVCLGNICRSPLAEGIFRHQVAERGLAESFHIESAGTAGWHVGSPPFHLSQKVAGAHGLALTSRAQQFTARDFARFDVVVALDESVAATLRQLAPTPADRAKIRLLRPYDPQANGERDVPDPYYSPYSEFERVYGMIDRACAVLLDELTQETPA